MSPATCLTVHIHYIVFQFFFNHLPNRLVQHMDTWAIVSESSYYGSTSPPLLTELAGVCSAAGRTSSPARCRPRKGAGMPNPFFVPYSLSLYDCHGQKNSEKEGDLWVRRRLQGLWTKITALWIEQPWSKRFSIMCTTTGLPKVEMCQSLLELPASGERCPPGRTPSPSGHHSPTQRSWLPACSYSIPAWWLSGQGYSKITSSRKGWWWQQYSPAKRTAMQWRTVPSPAQPRHQWVALPGDLGQKVPYEHAKLTSDISLLGHVWHESVKEMK